MALWSDKNVPWRLVRIANPYNRWNYWRNFFRLLHSKMTRAEVAIYQSNISLSEVADEEDEEESEFALPTGPSAGCRSNPFNYFQLIYEGFCS